MSVAAGAAGFRALKVIDKVRESSTITSFHLAPAEPGGWRAFEPGQFLVFKFPADNERGHVLRTYSVSCAPGHPGRYRISVKREASPRSGVAAPTGPPRPWNTRCASPGRGMWAMASSRACMRRG